MTAQPSVEVSIVVPVYQSQRTLPRCLEALSRQTRQDFETILVDSSPGSECERLVAAAGAAVPGLRFTHAPRRLLPQEAREVGVAMARAPLLLFTDPDCYAAPDWLERLLAAHRVAGGAVAGALACHGRRWLDRGVHLCKFSKWLPAGEPRAVDMGPTAALLIPRRLFERAGGFGGEALLGDIILSWTLRRGGETIWFEPRAVAEHHHLPTFRSFVAERYRRGKLFGHLRLDWLRAGRPTALCYLLASALPLRLATNLAHTARHAARAGMAAGLAARLPLVAAGHGAALAGEAVAYAGRLLRGDGAGRRDGSQRSGRAAVSSKRVNLASASPGPSSNPSA
ncbi:MAG: glycosyltransferase [Acidobacteria bacterium]|nr:glycosyltransferase [Acidobacteriota bacterium]